MDEIVNKVAASALEVFDLEDYFPKAPIATFDLADALWEGMVLKEKDFRAYVQSHDWSRYQGQIVLLTCSTDAIVPAWAYVLISVALTPWAADVYKGSAEAFLSSYYAKTLSQVDYEIYRNKPVILKGCSKKPVPDTAYLMAMRPLQEVARSVMYGEACSAVPLFKMTKS